LVLQARLVLLAKRVPLVLLVQTQQFRDLRGLSVLLAHKDRKALLERPDHQDQLEDRRVPVDHKVPLVPQAHRELQAQLVLRELQVQ
jgi:hypothetical protein